MMEFTPFGITGDDEDDDEDLENDDGFDVENEPVADDKLEPDENESDARSTSYIAVLFNKIKNFFKSK
uniref:Uncharacterized protein n=1 Tax=Panagrolaimus sp. PS1159 TaxID=55785 RepID=A0AC35FY82_9BILA